jgi:hypothetical protein
MILQERLLEVSRHFGWVLIPEILHNHAEEASKHNISVFGVFGLASTGGISG